MRIAVFDLDGTVINGDSVTMFLDTMLEHNIIDKDYRKQDDGLLELFYQGQVDIMAYYRFVLKPLIGKTPEQLAPLLDDFVNNKVLPTVYPKAKKLIKSKLLQDEIVIIASATTDILVERIAHALGIKYFVATKVLYDNKHRITGEVDPLICHQEGKVEHLNELCNKMGWNLSNSEGYGDSVNDIAMLKATTTPYAVCPKGAMLNYAIKHNIPVLNFNINLQY